MKHWIAAVFKQKCARMHQILFQFPFFPGVGLCPQTPGEGRERAGRGKRKGREMGKRGRGGEVCVIAVGG